MVAATIVQLLTRYVLLDESTNGEAHFVNMLKTLTYYGAEPWERVQYKHNVRGSYSF
jgi:hypothetical protein